MPSITKTKLELRAGLAALGVCAAVLSLPADAQEGALTVEVSECVDLPTPEQRLACFEAQVEAARKARGSAEPAAPGSAAPSAEAAPRAAERAVPAPRRAEPAPRTAERAAPRAEPEPARRAEPEPARRAEPAAAANAPAVNAPAPAANAPAPASSTPAPAPRVVEARVRTEPQAPAAQSADPDDGERLSRRERERAERLARPDIFATIAELRETVPNAYLITLDNGQVWRQTVPMSYRLREGAEVRLYPSQWGDGYRLTDDNLRGYIQVERVR